MRVSDKPVEIEHITCEICLKEVPASEAMVSEAMDYIVYLCGLDCYERWKAQQAKPDDQVKQPQR
ncbi:MAG TPA: DUF3330 domain-containing protein [Burkholderiaceae bacterium]|nr:DUF3330 domain-containing protein [Burkholderiaceae bacterium]